MIKIFSFLLAALDDKMHRIKSVDFVHQEINRMDSTVQTAIYE